MPRLHIFSWNAQGGSGNEETYETETKKLLMLQYVIDRINNEPCLILLQEEGAPDSTGYCEDQDVGYGFTCIYCGADKMASNLRCTIAVLANFSQLKVAGMISTGYTGRLVPVINVGDIIYVLTAHIIAKHASAIEETKTLIDKICQGKFSPWFLAGDFNSEPKSYPLYNFPIEPNVMNSIPYRDTTTIPKFCKILYVNKPTQGKNGHRTNVLDYAFASLDMDFPLQKYENILIKDEENNIYSDHNMMYYQLLI